MYSFIIVEEHFLLIDTGPESVPDRILAFWREANLEFAEEVSHLYMDGTFKLVPLIFRQIHAMLAERNG